MNGYQRLSAVIGLGAMVLGAGLLLVPALGTVGPVNVLQENITESAPEQVLLLTGAVVIGYLAVGLRRSAETPDRSPERRRFDRATAASIDGELLDRPQPEFDTDMIRAIQSGGSPLRAVRDELHQTVVGVYTDLYGTSAQAARETVDSGEWCHDPVASAFLAGDSGPTFSLGRRLRLFVTPKRERRHRIDRTITAIEELERQ
ncbi:MAG: hypothetical protein V5A52_03410 [Halovenus sp.]|uniref:DUF7269 family protein n=1 Tax=Halovenus amylolytica TaxID=2500550 RepID=UPI000FE3BD5D